MTSRTQKLGFLAVIAALIAIPVLPPGLARPLDPGQAQELSFVDSAGRVVPASSMRGRVAVLLFSGVQDPQCRDEIKALEALAERYNTQPVSVYWVSINSPSEMPNDRLKQPCGVATSVQTLRLSDINTFKRMSGRAATLPTVFVLNKLGEPYGRPRSGFNPNSDFVNDIAELVDSLLAQK